MKSSDIGSGNRDGFADDMHVKVQPGDNIWNLSEQVYGAGHHPLAAIYEENHLQPKVIQNKDGSRKFVPPTIYAGQELLFPQPEHIPELEQKFMSNLPAPHDEQTKATAQPDLATRIGNVTEALADGLIVGTIEQGIQQSMKDPLGTAMRAGTAIGLGAAFGLMTGGTGFIAEAATALGTGMFVAAGWDVLNPLDPKNAERNKTISKCLNTAWNTNDRSTMRKCDAAMRDALGRPGFDFALGAVGGVYGSRFARAFEPASYSASPFKPGSGTGLVDGGGGGASPAGLQGESAVAHPNPPSVNQPVDTRPNVPAAPNAAHEFLPAGAEQADSVPVQPAADAIPGTTPAAAEANVSAPGTVPAPAEAK